MEINYSYEIKEAKSFILNDVGNISIRANDKDFNYYYLIIDTYLGKTRIFEYGPINPDFALLPKKVKCNFERVDYNLKKLQLVITKFLNNPYSKIVFAEEIDKTEALNDCKDLINYMRLPEV